jgi:ribosomal protein S26
MTEYRLYGDNGRRKGIRQKFSKRGLARCLQCGRNIPVDQRVYEDTEPGPDPRGRWHRWWCSDR